MKGVLERPRVGFDARLWHHTGIGRYIRNVLPRLSAELTVWAAPSDVEAVRAAVPEATVLPCAAKPFSVAESLFWHRTLRTMPLDLFHSPHLNVPLSGELPLVVTLHDLIPLRFPGTIASPLGQWYFHAMAFLAARRAHRVIAVSTTTAADLVALLDAEPGKLRVVGEGADERFAEPLDPAFIAETRARYGLAGGRYLLYSGQWKPYKNLETLLEAFAQLRKRHGDLRLALVGRPDPRAAHVPAALARLGLEDAVVRTGYVEDERALAALYQGASLYAFPSRYEGFGLPPLEAMAAGVPVVASDAASIPEVVDDAAVLVDPGDVVKWSQALELVLTDQALRETLVQRGRERVKALTWELAARQTMAVYQEVLQDRSS